MAKITVTVHPFGVPSPHPKELLEKSGHDVVFNTLGRKLKPEEVAEFAGDSEVIVASTEDLEPLIRQSTKLRMISRVGIGLDSVPLKLCREKGIAVAYTPDAVTLAVSELTIGLMIDLLRSMSENNNALKNGVWSRVIGKRIEHSVIGIVGFGRVGSSVCRMLSGFRPKSVLVCDILDKSPAINKLKEQYGMEISQVGFDEVTQKSDIVTLHAPLTDITRNMIDSSALEKFKEGAYLINTARGQIVDEDALYDSLKNGRLAAAAIDVFHQEPYKGKLSELTNIVLTSHIGSCSEDCRYLMETHAAEDSLRFLDSQPLARPVPNEEYTASKR